MYRQSEGAQMESQGFLNRVANFPLSQDAFNQLNQVYEMAQSKPFLSMGVKGCEAGLSIASKVATPLVKRLPVDQIDAFACKQLDRFEDWVPAVKAKNTKELWVHTKDVGYRTVTLPITTAKVIKDASLQKIQSTKEYTVNRISQTYNTVHGSVTHSYTAVQGGIRGRVGSSYQTVQDGVFGAYEVVQKQCQSAKDRSKQIAMNLVQPVLDAKDSGINKVTSAQQALDNYHADLLSRFDVAVSTGFLKLLRSTDILLDVNNDGCKKSFEASVKKAVPEADFREMGVLRRHYALLQRIYHRNTQLFTDMKEEKQHIKEGAVNAVNSVQQKALDYVSTTRPIIYVTSNYNWAKKQAETSYTTGTEQVSSYYHWLTEETLPGRVVTTGVGYVWTGLGYGMDAVRFVYDHASKRMEQSQVELEMQPSQISSGFKPHNLNYIEDTGADSLTHSI